MATNALPRVAHASRSLPKAPTGISGLDEITGGGLPLGRPTLVCGTAGCGKTLLAMEFLVRGVTQFGEAGAYISFEETEGELAQNVRSLGFDVEHLAAQGKLAFDHILIQRSDIEEAGDYDLEGLFLRIGHAIDSVGAKRVVLDTIESLFSAFLDPALLRAELRRLFQWLKSKGVTAIITAERGDGTLTRQGLEEYVSDCVILLDHRIQQQVSTRRLRVVKYRGTLHGTNEYPFIIEEHGISVLPVTSLGLTHQVSSERVSTGIARLDAMLGGGYYRASSILVSGTAGSGKTNFAGHFAAATCKRGERCLYLAFEESAEQITRNLRSIGIDLEPWRSAGLLQLESSRPTTFGLETHLAQLHRRVSDFKPHVVIVDPVTSLAAAGSSLDTMAMLLRLIDFLKSQGITALLVSLTNGSQIQEATEVGISSLIDTWIVLRDIELGGERNRGLYVIKSRGMSHSNQIREFLITSEGINLLEVYVGPEGVLTGSLRAAQEAKERAAAATRREEFERKERQITVRRATLEAQMRALEQELHALGREAEITAHQAAAVESSLQTERAAAAVRRGKDEVAR